MACTQAALVRWSLGSGLLEQQTSSAAARVTEQPYLGTALLTSHEGGLAKVAQKLFVPNYPERLAVPIWHLWKAVEEKSLFTKL